MHINTTQPVIKYNPNYTHSDQRPSLTIDTAYVHRVDRTPSPVPTPVPSGPGRADVHGPWGVTPHAEGVSLFCARILHFFIS